MRLTTMFVCNKWALIFEIIFYNVTRKYTYYLLSNITLNPIQLYQYTMHHKYRYIHELVVPCLKDCLNSAPHDMDDRKDYTRHKKIQYSLVTYNYKVIFPLTNIKLSWYLRDFEHAATMTRVNLTPGSTRLCCCPYETQEGNE